MIWIEILSRHRDLATRFRVPGPEVLIGRGYDNDVIVDDPYVAARHLRLFRDGEGQLIAEDLGSTNGTFVDGSKSRLARFAVDGQQPIRIGQTFLRVRESSHVVEPERVTPAHSPILPVVAALVLGAGTLGLYGSRIWLNQVTEARLSTYLNPLLSISAAVLIWVGVWALLSRILSGRAHFLRNLIIALTGAFAVSLYSELSQYVAFAWTWPGPSSYEYVAIWSIVAWVCFLHLREVGRTRLWLKGAVVAVLLVAVIAVQALLRMDALSATGRQITVHVLMPPALRAVPYKTEGAFFGEVENLKAALDRDRVQAKPDSGQTR